MTTVIVPDSLRLAIEAKLDAAIAGVPDAAKDRDELYRQLVGFFHEHGYIPEFTLGKVERVTAEGFVSQNGAPDVHTASAEQK